MSTRITNITAGLATLPYPYRGAIGPGRGAIVSDDMPTVVANFGGPLQTEGVFRLDISNEPGQSQFDPAEGSPSVAYAVLPDPTTVGATAANPVIVVGPGGSLVYSDGTQWLNYEGAET